MAYSLGEKKSVVLRRYADTATVRIQAGSANRVFFQVLPKGTLSYLRGLYAYDLTSDKETWIENAHGNGSVCAFPDGEFLIIGTGL
jgi:hypothetical protein